MKVPNFRILCWRRVCRKVCLKGGRVDWGGLEDIVLFCFIYFFLFFCRGGRYCR